MFCLFAVHCHNIIYLVRSTGIESYFEVSVCIGASNFVLRFCAYTIVISSVADQWGRWDDRPRDRMDFFGTTVKINPAK